MRKFYRLLAICVILVFASTVLRCRICFNEDKRIEGRCRALSERIRPSERSFHSSPFILEPFGHAGKQRVQYPSQHHGFPRLQQNLDRLATSLKSDPLSNGVRGCSPKTSTPRITLPTISPPGRSGAETHRRTRELVQTVLNAVADKMAYMDAYYRPTAMPTSSRWTQQRAGKGTRRPLLGHKLVRQLFPGRR